MVRSSNSRYFEGETVTVRRSVTTAVLVRSPELRTVRNRDFHNQGGGAIVQRSADRHVGDLHAVSPNASLCMCMYQYLFYSGDAVERFAGVRFTAAKRGV